MKTSHIATGIMGLAAGVVLGILFAPAEGAKTRKKILKKKLELKRRLCDKIEELISKTEAKADEQTASA